jgi:hypothetical protein
MSRRTHFWLRIIGLGLIVAVEVVPRFYAKDHAAAAAESARAQPASHAAVAAR